MPEFINGQWRDKDGRLINVRVGTGGSAAPQPSIKQIVDHVMDPHGETQALEELRKETPK